MGIRLILILLACLLDSSMGASLQASESFVQQVEKQNLVLMCLIFSQLTLAENPKPEAKDIFSIIEASNKDDNKLKMEGDILLKIGRSAIKCENDGCRWIKNSNGTVNVPYTISPDYNANQLSTIAAAMQDFATLTCVRFVPRTTEPDFIAIISDSGCWSYVGKTGGSQEVSLSRNGCVTLGTVQHELNHALGFYHEQSRSDRDNYIDIITDDILPGLADNFDKYDTNNLGLEYDYSSVMHYGRFAFSRSSSLPTIVPKPDPNVPIGQRYGLSSLDISKINKLYQCGVCSTLLSDSVGTLVSTNYPSDYPNNGKCFWQIRAPSDQVFLQFNAFDVQSSTGCTADYLKVYDGANTSSPVLLDRACGTGRLPSLVASSNMMLLEFVSDSQTSATGFKGTYHTVNCGATLTKSSGVFTTQNYPIGYPALSNCSWVIIAPVGFKVSLNMTDFYVESQRTCSYDYMLVFDGPQPTYPLLGRYCGAGKVPNQVSTGNYLLVQFFSDASVQPRGFMAKYSIAEGFQPYSCTPSG
ncbi:embryonic protein UVS.2-like [Pelodytes ibericus]